MASMNNHSKLDLFFVHRSLMCIHFGMVFGSFYCACADSVVPLFSSFNVLPLEVLVHALENPLVGTLEGYTQGIE